MTVCAASVAALRNSICVRPRLATNARRSRRKETAWCIDSVALAPLTVPADGSYLRLSVSICGYFCDVAQKPFTMGFVGVPALDTLHHYPRKPLDKLWAQDPLSPVATFIGTGEMLVDKSNVDNFVSATSQK